jgi:phospholipase C
MSLCGYSKIDTTAGEPVPLPDHETILDWCDAQQLRWRVYSESLSFTTLFTARRPHSLEADPEHFRSFSALAHDFQSESAATFPHFILIEPAYSDDPFVDSPRDNHPPNPIGPGEALVADVYRAVTSNLRRWQRTVAIFTYDEHGGFYDHVPPFPVTTEPPGFEDDAWKDRTAFTTSGPRVPALIVSPLVGRGSSSRLRFDHTSVLQLMADLAAPGYAYSEQVKRRHLEGQIHSVSELFTGAVREGAPPVLPPFKAARWIKPEWRGKIPAGAAAFQQAHASLAAQRLEVVRSLAARKAPQLRLGKPGYLSGWHAKAHSP